MMTIMIDVDKTNDRNYENDESNLESDDDQMLPKMLMVATT